MKTRLHSFDGLSLCSQRDPVREAQQWCDHVLVGGPEERYWVLGLGAGYHVQALAERCPKAVIAVIEFRKPILESFASWGAPLRGQVLATYVENPQDILTSREFELLGLSFPPVLSFMPALQGLEGKARQTEAHLLGKTAESFSIAARHFGFNLESSGQRLAGLEQFNIKTIDSLFDGQSATQERKIVSLMRELVR